METSNFPAFPIPQLHRNTGMSVRVYAAIHLKVPDSGIAWLDDMIEKSVEREVLGRSLQRHKDDE